MGAGTLTGFHVYLQDYLLWLPFLPSCWPGLRRRVATGPPRSADAATCHFQRPSGGFTLIIPARSDLNGVTLAGARRRCSGFSTWVSLPEWADPASCFSIVRAYGLLPSFM